MFRVRMSRRQIPIAVDLAMLSKLWYFRLLDDRGRRHALADIAVALLESDYPVVTDLLYRNSQGEQMMLPWHAVKGIDWHPTLGNQGVIEKSGLANARRDRRTCARFA